MILSLAPDTTISMDCFCEACLDVLTTPPTDYIDLIDIIYDMAAEACWRDDYDPRSDLDIGDFL